MRAFSVLFLALSATMPVAIATAFNFPDPATPADFAVQKGANRVIWENVVAKVKYRDGSEKRIPKTGTLSGTSTSSSDVKLAAKDPSAFLITVVRKEALFPCDIIDGPSGRVTIGEDP